LEKGTTTPSSRTCRVLFLEGLGSGCWERASRRPGREKASGGVKMKKKKRGLEKGPSIGAIALLRPSILFCRGGEGASLSHAGKKEEKKGPSLEKKNCDRWLVPSIAFGSRDLKGEQEKVKLS